MELDLPSSVRIGSGAFVVAGGTFTGGISFTSGALRGNPAPDGGPHRAFLITCGTFPRHFFTGGAFRGGPSLPEAVVFGGESSYWQSSCLPTYAVALPIDDTHLLPSTFILPVPACSSNGSSCSMGTHLP